MRTRLEERCLEFGVGVLQLARSGGDLLTKQAREQLVSSATSIGANVAEARSAQSRDDFISKLEIALKEARETDYWLCLLYRAAAGHNESLKGLMRECDEITAMLVASVRTAKGRQKPAMAAAEGEVRAQRLSQSAEW